MRDEGSGLYGTLSVDVTACQIYHDITGLEAKVNETIEWTSLVTARHPENERTSHVR